MFDDYFREACALVILISGVPLALSAASGFVVAVFQASTQIQEQSIAYVVKLSTVCASLFILWEWASIELVRFLQHVLDSFLLVGQG